MLQARFIPGVENSLADAISRNRLDVLFDLYPQVCRTSVRLNLEVVRSLVLEGIGRRIPGGGGWPPCRGVGGTFNEEDLFVRAEEVF